MKKKSLILTLSALVIVACMGGAMAGCSKDFKVESSDATYNPALGFTAPSHVTDSNINLDGVLDEAVYNAEGHRWYNGLKIDGTERAKIDVTTVFGNEGIYVAFDVTELTNGIFYNPDRSSWLNSGVEMYLALEGTTSIDSKDYTTFEIDMECSGRLTFKRRFMDGWANVSTTYDISPVYAASLKGGNYNQSACYGYSGELFIPYDFLEYLGILEDDKEVGQVYINPVLITSYSYEGTLQSDRNWYNLAAADTDGDGWANPSSFLHFDENGFVSYDIKTEITGNGSVSTPKGYKFAVADNSLTLNILADDGYTLDALTVNDEDYKGKITYQNYNAQLYFSSVTENLNVKASFKPVTGTPHLINGKIIPEGVEASKGISDMQVKYFDGFKYVDLRTVDGAFAGYVPEGQYKLVVVSKSMGFEVTEADITVSDENTSIIIGVDDTMYGVNRAIRFDGIEIAGGSTEVALNNPVTAEKFVFAFRLGVAEGKNFPADIYVEDFRLVADNGDYITFALVRWNGNFVVKIYTRGHADQEVGGLDASVTSAAIANGYIDFVVVRDGRTLTVYGYGEDGALHQIGTASLYDTVSNTQINTFVLWARDNSDGYGAKV